MIDSSREHESGYPRIHSSTSTRTLMFVARSFVSFLDHSFFITSRLKEQRARSNLCGSRVSARTVPREIEFSERAENQIDSQFSKEFLHTHTHTHTSIYIYIYILNIYFEEQYFCLAGDHWSARIARRARTCHFPRVRQTFRFYCDKFDASLAHRIDRIRKYSSTRNINEFFKRYMYIYMHIPKNIAIPVRRFA